MAKIPVTIVVGFLGSGKTTVITNLVKYLESKNQKVVYIKNELGFEDLDAELIKNAVPSLIAKKITVGALHHAPLGQMRAFLHEAIEQENPDRIIIETAGSEGTADPVSLSVLVKNDPLFYCDGFFRVIDVENFSGYDQLEDYTKDKAKLVDLILLNKVELVDQKRREIAVEYIREYNEVSPIIEVLEGKMNPNVAFGVDMQDNEAPPKIKLYEDHINAINYISEKTFDKAKIEEAFKNMPKTIFRLKGFVKTQNGLEIFNGVHKRFDWLENTDQNRSDQTKLIIVGSDVEKEKDSIFSMLDACQI